MKYNSSNKPLVCMQTQSTCYKGTDKMTVRGVLWHSTGANNPWLKRYVQPSDNATDREEMLKLIGKNSYNNDWNHITIKAGLNGWIGKLADGTVASIQTMPWDWAPWGCGSGSKGSCNDGWIQFEICEDGLTDKAYFDKVYKEACELTAYLCEMFNLDPNGTVNYNGVKVPVILCHADSYDLKLGSNHGDVDHWFPKHGKSMATARADVAALMKKDGDLGSITPVAPTKKTYYRVRKTWKDAASQKGAFTDLVNAKALVDKLGSGYYVFDESGKAIYPEAKATTPTTSNGHKVGDEVKLIANATYASGTDIPQWVKNSKLYVREIRTNGDIVFSTQKTGAVTGVTKATNLVKYTATQTSNTSKELKVGDEVKLVAGAKFSNGQTIQNWVFKSKLYVRGIRSNGEVIISTLQSGAITGVVHKNNLVKYSTPTEKKVQVTADGLRVREGAGTNYKAVGMLQKYAIVTILEEKNGWGKTSQGWIFLDYTKRV